MPTLILTVEIKVRAFFTDLFKYSRTWTVPLPPIAETVGTKTLVDSNERGVHITLTLKA